MKRSFPNSFSQVMLKAISDGDRDTPKTLADAALQLKTDLDYGQPDRKDDPPFQTEPHQEPPRNYEDGNVKNGRTQAIRTKLLEVIS